MVDGVLLAHTVVGPVAKHQVVASIGHILLVLRTAAAARQHGSNSSSSKTSELANYHSNAAWDEGSGLQ